MQKGRSCQKLSYLTNFSSEDFHSVFSSVFVYLHQANMSFQEKQQLTASLRKFLSEDCNERDVQRAINNFVLLLAALSIPVSTAHNIIMGGNVSDVPHRAPQCLVKCDCKGTFHTTLGHPKKMDPTLQVFGKSSQCVKNMHMK